MIWEAASKNSNFFQLKWFCYNCIFFSLVLMLFVFTLFHFPALCPSISRYFFYIIYYILPYYYILLLYYIYYIILLYYYIILLYYYIWLIIIYYLFYTNSFDRTFKHYGQFCFPDLKDGWMCGIISFPGAVYEICQFTVQSENGL